MSERPSRPGGLIEALGTAADQLRARRARATEAGDKISLRERIESLGFGEDAGRVIDLLPLLHVAWADGAIQQGERDAIMHVLGVRGISAGSPAYLVIEALLQQRPSEIYVDESLEVLVDMVQMMDYDPRNLVSLCMRVAEASGDLLGAEGNITHTEWEMIQRIVDRFGDQARAELERKLG